MCATQVESAELDADVRGVFADDDNQLLLLETGFRKPLTSLTCDDKPAIKTAIRDYHTLVKTKPEMDQFADELAKLHVLEYMKKYPSLIAPLFVDKGDVYLNKGGIMVDLAGIYIYT